MYYIAFDIGGSSVKFSIIDKYGHILMKGNFSTPNNLNSFYDYILKAYRLAKKNNHITGAAFSLPGPVDKQHGMLISCPALKYLQSLPLRHNLSNLLGIPTAIENDANCAALGEAWVGAGRKFNDLAYIIIGTGVGGALVHNKEIITGHHNFGGEIGSMIMNDKYEILGNLGSVGGLVRRMAKLRNVPPSSLNGNMIFDLKEQGDQTATELINNMYSYLARSVHNIQYIYDPEAICIGGAISQRPEFIPTIRNYVKLIHNNFTYSKISPQIIPCQYGNDANLLGAVYTLINS